MKIRTNKDLTFLNEIKISHRGLWNSKYPENSMGAFRNSIRNNKPIELDVHILKDNTLVVIHDDNTKRMTNKNLTLKNCNYKDIKRLTLKNSKYKIPKLKEVLDLVDGRVLLDIELKTDVKSFRLCKEIIKLLDNYPGKFVVKSFNPLYVLWFRIHRPEFVRGLLVSELKKTKINKLVKFLCYHMCFNHSCKPDFIACDKRILPNKKIEKFYKKNKPVLVWTTNEMDNIRYNGIIYENKKLK